MHEKVEAAGGGLSNEARVRILTGLEPMSSAE
jgi:hypothetical protein